MVRISKSLKLQKDKSGKSGHYHRDHRSTKSRQLHNAPVIKKKRLMFKRKLEERDYHESMREFRESLLSEEGFI